MSKIYRDCEDMKDMKYKRYVIRGTCYFMLFIRLSWKILLVYHAIS